MKKSLLFLITILSSVISFSQTTVTLDQQTAYYYSNQSFNAPAAPGPFYNSDVSTISMLTNANSNSYVVAWRKFNTANNNTGTNRSLKIGDQFSVTVNAYRAKGEIGVALLASPSTTASYADRSNNYAVSVNLDGSDSLGSNNFGKWYVRGSNGDTVRAGFGGNSAAQGSSHNYQIDFLLTAADRMNVTISDLTVTSNKITFYDVRLNSSNPLTDYSIYLSNADDGSLVAKNIYWSQVNSVTNTGVVSLGQSNKSFTISQSLTDGTDAASNVAATNSFSKDGSGNITLGATGSFTGSTAIVTGTLTLGAVNALPTTLLGSVGNVILNGGTLSSGSTSGFSLGTAANPAGILALQNNSIISLGTGSHNLFFTNSSGFWTAGKALTINGWVGTTAGGGTSGKIFIGTNGSGLTATQLTKITFTGYGTKAQFDVATGEIKPLFDAEPTIGASNLNFTNVQLTSHTVNFTPGNGTGGRIVVVRAASPPSSGPVNGTTYTGNTSYGSGSSLGSGFVAYATTGAAAATQSFTITGLTSGTTYYYNIYEYNGTGSGAVYGPAYQGSQISPSFYSTITDGNWENTATWNCNCIPPANAPVSINNNVTLTQNESASTVVIASGKTLADGGFTLTVSTSIVNNGTHSGTGRIKMLATNDLPISGTGTYQNVESAVTSGGNLNLTSNVTINGILIITSDAVVIGSNTLRLNGAFSGIGTLTGSSSSNLTIGGTSGPIPFTTSSSATRSLSNLSLISGTTSLNTALDLYGNVSFTGSSSLNFNAQTVTLKSTATQNGTIGNLGTSSLSGATNIIAERYLSTARRAYRSLSSNGLNTPGSIQSNWQEGAMNTAIGTNVDPNPGYGTMITGTGGNTNGFDVSQTNQYSLYTFNNVSGAYQAVLNTNVNKLDSKTGYLMYVRGDRSIDITSQANPLPSTVTTLRQSGTLNSGNQVFTGLVGNSDGGANNGYNLISNPYAAYIDWFSVQSFNSASGISLNYFYLDPAVGAQGGYVSVNASTNVYSPDPGHAVTNTIQPGQAFFVQVYTGGGVPIAAPSSFTIREADKLSSGNNPSVFKNQTAQQLFRASIFFNEKNGNRRIADGCASLFDNKYGLNIDQFDTPNNEFDENIAIVRKGVNLKIEARPTIAQKDTIQLYINSMKVQAYEMELQADNFPPNITKAELIDNFLGTRSNIALSGKSVVPFTITTNSASKAQNRFYVVFQSTSPLPVTLNNFNVIKQNDGAMVTWIVNQETDIDKYEIERSINSLDFSKIGSINSKGNSSLSTAYTYFDGTPIRGTSFYRLKMIDKNSKITYSQIVKLDMGGSLSNISVYPNPVNGNNVYLNFENIAKGDYPVTISNSLGQIVYTHQIKFLGGSSIQTINIGNSLISGTYELKVGTYVVKLLKQK